MSENEWEQNQTIVTILKFDSKNISDLYPMYSIPFYKIPIAYPMFLYPETYLKHYQTFCRLWPGIHSLASFYDKILLIQPIDINTEWRIVYLI